MGDEDSGTGAIVSRLRTIRKDAGLSGTQLAAKLGYGSGGHTSVSRAERGIDHPDIGLIERWIEACECDVYIVARSRKPKADEAAAVLAALDDDRRELVMRLARLAPFLEGGDLDRLMHDVEYLETRLGRGRR
jgi:transcriptional regulator with XRE-family HTH domain